MKRRYRAELMMPDYPHSWNVTTTRSFRSLESARRQCERWMVKKTIVTTNGCRIRDVNRGWDCRIADLKKDPKGRILACDRDISPPVVIVPSVGEQGYG